MIYKSLVLIYENPDAAHTLLQKCTDFIMKYCMALKLTGANGVVMAEPAAGLMSNDDCKTFSSPIRKTYRRSRTGRQLYRCLAQLWKHRTLPEGNGRNQCSCLPLR